MNNIELTEKIGTYLKGSKTKAKKFKDLVAVHFNLLDVSENMYIEVKDGVLSVMPYEYNDRQATVTASTETLDKLFSGALSMDEAISAGYVQVEGDADKFKALAALIPTAKAEEKKPAAKKAPAKKEAPKAEAPAAKKAPAKKEAPKAEEKKPAAKKEAPKAEVKAEVKAEAKTAVKAEEKKAPAKKCCKSKK